MTLNTCDYANRDDVIVSYLYDDLDGAAHAAFDDHLSACAVCRAEISDLRAVRRQLGKWEAPAVASLQASVPSPQLPAPSPQSWWQEVPMWARAAAAVLCLGAAAGLANIDIRYDNEGLAVRTGWMQQSPVTSRQSPAAVTSLQSPSPGASPAASAPWRADLIELERQLRTEFRSAGNTAKPTMVAAAPAMSEAELLRRVRGIVEESERRQERELALRVGEVIRNVNAQRQVDMRKIDTNLGFIQNNTGAEVMRQRQMLMRLVAETSRGR